MATCSVDFLKQIQKSIPVANGISSASWEVKLINDKSFKNQNKLNLKHALETFHGLISAFTLI